MNVNNDAMGNRISKTVINKNVATDKEKSVTTYYVRDPQGNVLAVYEHKHGDSDNGTFTLTEQHLQSGENGYESQLDSPDDQKSIKKGIFHAQSHKYRKIKKED